MDPKQLGSSRLAAERSLHIFELRLEQELKEKYNYFMRKFKGLDHGDPVNSQEGRDMLLSTNRPVFREINSPTTLGLLRNPKNYLQVKNNTTQVQKPNSTASTKQKVLDTTASIFDPLGLLSPPVITLKIFLQKLWQDKLKWDELLTAHLQQEWNHLLQTIPKLSQLKINRKVICSNADNIQLHGICKQQLTRLWSLPLHAIHRQKQQDIL